MKELSTCVHPRGCFVWGLHKPRFEVINLRSNDFIGPVGFNRDRQVKVTNKANFPAGNVKVPQADWIYEIRNPLGFRGTTYIGKRWADTKAAAPETICLAAAEKTSLHQSLAGSLQEQASDKLLQSIFQNLPRCCKLALAVNSTDSRDLVRLAETACEFSIPKDQSLALALSYVEGQNGTARPRIHDHELFEAVANNPFLPDQYKQAMVLRPGVQGSSEIVGEWSRGSSHVFEYLRSNSYIPWGHFAANMAHDAVRYSIGNLAPADMRGMRHLYYQRTYLRLARALNIDPAVQRRCLGVDELEKLRLKVMALVSNPDRAARLPYKATLWGWNYGFDFTPSGYRLHASHQQIHQQYALIPATVSPASNGRPLESYGCGDLVQQFTRDYRRLTGKGFFETYFRAVLSNRRTDGRDDLPSDLLVYEDTNVWLLVPKAQTSQWELQLVCRKAVGNIVEAGRKVRQSLDKGLFLAMKILSAMGARMITVLEYPKPFIADDDDQHLMYVFLPRLPQSPGAFSEAQFRWINGHYPEDFARACRRHLESVLERWEQE